MRDSRSTSFLREKDVSTLLNTTIPSLRYKRYKGIGIPYHKVGRFVRYSVKDVASYLN